VAAISIWWVLAPASSPVVNNEQIDVVRFYLTFIGADEIAKHPFVTHWVFI
jgi:hypothetical protein